MNNKEIRMYDMSLNKDSDEMILEGYALKFEEPATHGNYTEIIDRHALDNTDMSDVCMKYNHSDTNYILARTRNKSLELKVDDIGLWFRANLIDTTTNIDAYKMIKAQLLDKCSFAFSVRKDSKNYDESYRRILDIDKLFDIAVVDVPFYDNTEVLARNMKQFEEEKEKYQALKLAKVKAKAKLSLN